MEWNEKLQRIIDYVEDHLQRREEPIDENVVSDIAGCSFGFFQKVFSYMNGISFSEYVRSRKLTLAGYDLKSTDLKVVDISYKYGYASPTSFTKAFQQFHGITPKEARDGRSELKIAPKMQISNRQQYSWHIDQKESFRLIGKSKTFSCKNGEHYLQIPKFWSECHARGDTAKLISLDRGNPKGIFGLFTFLSNMVPPAVCAVTFLWCAIVMVAQAFKDCDKKHYAAVGIAMVPPVADYLYTQITGSVGLAGYMTEVMPSGLAEYNAEVTQMIKDAGVMWNGVPAVKSGAIIIGILLGTMTVFIIDKQLHKVAITAVVGYVLACFGFIHSAGLGFNPASPFAIGYLIVAVLAIILHQGRKSWFEGPDDFDYV